MNTGDLIRQARKARNLTQKQLGDLCGMADSAIRRYESGRGNPTLATLKRIANALEIDLFDLIPEDHKKGFEDIPSYFSSENHEERDKAHQVEEILLTNALNISYYQKLIQITNLSDKAIEAPLTEFDEAILKSVLLGSFNQLNLRGKYEAVERIAELELIPRFAKKRKPPQD